MTAPAIPRTPTWWKARRPRPYRTAIRPANVPMDFIQEVQVKSSGFEAEYGGALGGVVNVIQKRGSNEWHGSLFTYYGGDA